MIHRWRLPLADFTEAVDFASVFCDIPHARTISAPPGDPQFAMKRFAAAVGMLALVLGPRTALAQDGKEDRRPPAQIQDSIRIAAHARSLVEGAASDSARAARLYEWTARNLRYDARGYLTGRVASMKPEAVWNSRAAVCEGFVQLYQRMAEEVGLRTEIVNGYAKGFDYRPGQSVGDPNHAWIAAEIDGRWRLLDPTWGAGLVVNGEFRPEFSWAYLFTAPEVLQLSHHPEDRKWQLAERPLSRREFERMPAVPRLLVDAGFSPAELRAAGLRRNAAYPLVGSIQGGVRVVRAPADGVLPEDAPVSFEIVWPNAQEVAVVSGGAWTQLERQGNTFSGGTVAVGDVVQLVGKRGGSDEYQTLLHYRVN